MFDYTPARDAIERGRLRKMFGRTIYTHSTLYWTINARVDQKNYSL